MPRTAEQVEERMERSLLLAAKIWNRNTEKDGKGELPSVYGGYATETAKIAFATIAVKLFDELPD